MTEYKMLDYKTVKKMTQEEKDTLIKEKKKRILELKNELKIAGPPNAQKRRTLYLEKKYLGDNAVVKSPIALPPLSTLPYDLRTQIINFEWKNTRKKWRPHWDRARYINSLYTKSRSSIIGIAPTAGHYYYTGKLTPTRARYTNNDLKKIIDNMLPQRYYKSNTKKADLWKIIMKYD